tara:strand:- start:19 stop:1017 length:999 start_codon:yes stop_codon:yes gene_type:complete
MKEINMKLIITGTLRDIANSAWISTTDEISTKLRSDEDVDKVTTFLAKNFHTSPFECISLKFEWLGQPSQSLIPYIESAYSRSIVSEDSASHLTIDLWNFIKVSSRLRSSKEEGFNAEDLNNPWNLFKRTSPELASKAALFEFDAQKFYNSPNVYNDIGKTNMKVELISFHNTGADSTSRATWRIKCPLSIATQILRHRTGSFNQVSGRYRTIKSEFVQEIKDVNEIFNKAISDDLLKEYSDCVESCMRVYGEVMNSSKKSRDLGVITNDEYKRAREVARYILPEGRMTELYVTFYLDDFKGYLKLRDSEHAQKEHVWIAQMMRDSINNFIE